MTTRLLGVISFAWETTVGDQLDRNVHVGGGAGEDDYVAMREARDATLKPPKLLYPAIQVNIRGGRMPPPDANGMRYIKVPLSHTLVGEALPPGARRGRKRRRRSSAAHPSPAQ